VAVINLLNYTRVTLRYVPGVEVGFEVVYSLFLILHCSGFRAVEPINMFEYPHPLSYLLGADPSLFNIVSEPG